MENLIFKNKGKLKMNKIIINLVLLLALPVLLFAQYTGGIGGGAIAS